MPSLTPPSIKPTTAPGGECCRETIKAFEPHCGKKLVVTEKKKVLIELLARS